MSSIFYCTNLREYLDPEKKRATGATILPAFYIEHSANCDGWSISFFNTWKMANGSLNGFYNFQFSLLHKVYDQFEYVCMVGCAELCKSIECVRTTIGARAIRLICSNRITCYGACLFTLFILLVHSMESLSFPRLRSSR